MKDLTRTLRLISIAARPVGGHYVGMATKRPITLEQRLLWDVRDLTRLARAAGPRAEYWVAPVLDYLEMALDIPHMGPTNRAQGAPAVFGNVSAAALDAAAAIDAGDAIPAD
jgi:hypothetical protein